MGVNGWVFCFRRKDTNFRHEMDTGTEIKSRMGGGRIVRGGIYSNLQRFKGRLCGKKDQMKIHS